MQTKRTLRVFISNLAANQPHFDRSDADGDGYGQDRVYPQQPSWTLRIEGRLLEHNVRGARLRRRALQLAVTELVYALIGILRSDP